ncbi:hypothetical protein, partial [Qipengyuania sp.]|uniref:hypothetical protein n=1 Tax=Qipengyuania sp. TaxID=2004515 RepID=UPI0035C7B529
VAVRYRVRGRLGARRILGPVTTGAFVGLEGPPGEQGPQGVPGAPGANGNSSFTHYAYANSADGSIDFTIGAPGERAFEGVYVDQVEADSTNPASYAWREYKGPPFGMAGTNVSIAGNQVIKVPSAAYEWNSQAYSTVGYKNGCRTAFRIGNDQRVMAGLNQDPTADSSYNSLDYAWYVNETEVKIYRSGSEIPGFVIPNYIGQGTFEVVYDGRYVRFLYLGVERHKEDIGPGYQFYFDSSIATVQGRIADVEFGAFPQQRSGNVTLLTQTSANTEVLGGSARNTVNLGWGAGLVYSQEQYARGASVSWTYPAGPNSNMMAGLEEVPTGDKGNSYESVTFAIFRRDDGVTAAYVQGAQLPFAGPTVDMNQPTRCRVQFDGKKYVRFYINDVEFANYEWYGSVNPLRFRAAMASLGARVEDVTLTGSGKDGDKGEKGDPGADGLQGPQGIQGPAGSNGQTSYVHFAYADSADGTVNFTTGAAAGRTYIGVYSDFTAADSNSPGAYTWSLIKGAQGDQGTPGPAGSNGQPSYVHIAYANSANGQTDFHLSDPTGRTYIGVYTDGTPADSGDPAAYTWSLIKGADGQDGFTISPPSTAWSIATTQNGVPKSGQLPRSVTLKVLRGSADITGSCIFALANTTGFSGSMSGATFTATGLSVDSAKASVVVTYQGVQIGTVEITLDKQPEGAAAQQFKQSFNALGNTATYAFTQQIDVTVPAGSTLSADATASYSTTSTTYKPQLKLTYQNLTDGGAELDFEGNNPASGETAYVSEPAGVFGPSGSLPTGHTSSKTYRVKLYSRRETGAGSSTNVSGNLYVRTS